VTQRTHRKLDKRSQIVGKTYNGVVILSATNKIKNKGVVFNCLCHCGKEFESLGSILKNGHRKSCGCLHTQAKFKVGRITSIDDVDKAYRYKFTEYRGGCKRGKRQIPFELTFPEFRDIITKNCTYCDTEPYMTTVNKGQTYVFRAKMVGVDRLDNDKGYTKTNCVPCCRTCNMMKKNLSLCDFTEHIYRIAHNIGRSTEKIAKVVKLGK